MDFAAELADKAGFFELLAVAVRHEMEHTRIEVREGTEPLVPFANLAHHWPIDTDPIGAESQPAPHVVEAVYAEQWHKIAQLETGISTNGAMALCLGVVREVLIQWRPGLATMLQAQVSAPASHSLSVAMNSVQEPVAARIGGNLFTAFRMIETEQPAWERLCAQTAYQGLMWLQSFIANGRAVAVYRNILETSAEYREVKARIAADPGDAEFILDFEHGEIALYNFGAPIAVWTVDFLQQLDSKGYSLLREISCDLHPLVSCWQLSMSRPA